MIKNRKVINIIITAFLLITLSFLLIFNGCTNTSSNNIDTALQEDISSDASGVSQESSDQSQESQESSNETVATENESKDTDDPEEENKQDGSSQGSDTSEEQDNSLRCIYDRFVESGKPSMLVFSYDADCCPGTKAFFESYNTSAKKLMEEYKAKFNVLFINIGILDKTNMETAIEIATQNEVLNLPSILLLDSSGKSHKVVEGVFDEAEVKKILGGMLND